VTFNLNYKYDPDQEELPRKSGVIEYIEESFKMNPKPPKPLPPLPKKQLAISICLMTIGLICILVGTVLALDGGNSKKGIAFWIIGAIAGLPGLFYALKFCRACYANTAEGRSKALEDLPQE